MYDVCDHLIMNTIWWIDRKFHIAHTYVNKCDYTPCKYIFGLYRLLLFLAELLQNIICYDLICHAMFWAYVSWLLEFTLASCLLVNTIRMYYRHNSLMRHPLMSKGALYSGAYRYSLLLEYFLYFSSSKTWFFTEGDWPVWHCNEDNTCITRYS